MNSDSDLYGDDIRLWSERQGALLRRVSVSLPVRASSRARSSLTSASAAARRAGEAVSDRVDWQHVVGDRIAFPCRGVAADAMRFHSKIRRPLSLPLTPGLVEWAQLGGKNRGDLS
jgi:hypothetical protein